jgi:zinc protease
MNGFILAGKTGFVCCLLTFATGIFAKPQQQPQQQPQQDMTVEKLIKDPELRYGILENGLTYYIRHNEMPGGQAEFYFVQNSGSMQEEDYQRGFARFIEHMAFCGTKHFSSSQSIAKYTGGNGDRQPGVGFEETVYKLSNVPVKRESVIDSCLLILRDWSSAILLDDVAIERERRRVLTSEAWHTAQTRLLEQQIPEMYPGSKYAIRLPAGRQEVIENLKGEELRAFYRTWYRPELQAVIVVGDIDVARLEAKLRRLFADIPRPAEPLPPVTLSPVPDNAIPLISIAEDREITQSTLTLYYKHETLPFNLRGTMVEIITGYTREIVSQIMSERFSEIVRKAGAPVVSASAGDGDYFIARTKGAWTATAVVKRGALDAAFATLVAETERVRKSGFTEDEYERARERLLALYASNSRERNRLPNAAFARDYIRHFTEEACIPGAEASYEIIRRIAPSIPLEAVNRYVRNLFEGKDDGRNVVISLAAPERESIGKNDLFRMFRAAGTAGAAPKTVVNKPLLPRLPARGSIVEERDDSLFGATFFRLSNGVRVVVKETDFKKGEVLMTATSPGGTSLFPDEKDVWNLKVMNNTILLGGLGEFSAADLQRALAGRNIACSAGVGEDGEQINGSASPADLKTLLELVYLQFTALRVDDDAYAAFEKQVRAQLEHQALNPVTAFSDTLTGLIYDGNPRNRRLRAADFDRIDYRRTIDMYRERYADASDFLFTFVGDVSKETIRPLLEQYLATLPAPGRNERADEAQVTPFRRGRVEKHFSARTEIPKSSVALMYTGVMPYHLTNLVTAQLLTRILEVMYAGKEGLDDVRLAVDLRNFPRGRASIQIYFDADPARCDEMVRLVKSGLESIAAGDLQAAYLDKSRADMVKGRAEVMKQNAYWLNVIDACYAHNLDVHTTYDRILHEITATALQSFTQTLLDQGNALEVIMSPPAR